MDGSKDPEYVLEIGRFYPCGYRLVAKNSTLVSGEADERLNAKALCAPFHENPAAA